MELTDKQKIFISEYVVDFNGTRAAIKAGYSKNSARQIATELLSKPYIRVEIDKVINELNEKCHIKRERVINEIASIAFDDISNYMNFGTDEDGSTWVKLKENATVDTKNISEISVGKDGQVKFKTYCRDIALYKLAEYLGIDRTVVEQTGSNYDAMTVDELRGLLNESKSSNNPKT